MEILRHGSPGAAVRRGVAGRDAGRPGRESRGATGAAAVQDSTSTAVLLLPASNPYGHSYGEWAAQWWMWTLSLPNGHNPAVSTDPKLASEGQSGPVWFLAGTFEAGAKVREVAVPAGKAIFVPLINTAWLSFPDDPPVSPKCAQQDYQCLRRLVRPAIDAAVVAAEIDGVPVSPLVRFREDSPVFYPTVPINNPFKLPSGEYGPCVDAGYYLMLAPPTPGIHTIHVTAQTGDFALELTYLPDGPVRR